MIIGDLSSEFSGDPSEKMQPMAVAGKQEIHWITKIMEKDQNGKTPSSWPPAKIAQRHDFTPQCHSR